MASIPSYGSLNVNGQLIPVLTARASTKVPPVLGPALNGPGQMPLQTLPRIPGGAGAGGGAFTPTAMPAAMGQSESLSTGAKITLVVMLVVGIVGLRYVHWSGR